MKATIDQAALAAALATAGRAASARHTMPILSTILLETTGNELRLAATDLELSISTHVEIDSQEDGAVCVPAQLLVGFVKSLAQGGAVSLELGKGLALQLRQGRTRATLKCIKAEEFPNVGGPTGDLLAIVDAQALRAMVEQVAVAAAADVSRAMFTGAMTVFTADRVQMIAADGFRLAMRSIASESGPQDEQRALIPARSLREATKILPDGQVTIARSATGGLLVFRSGQVEVSTRLIDAQFPNYQQIIPKSHETRVLVNAAGLLAAVHGAALFAKDSADIVRLHVEGDALFIRSESQENGDSESAIDVEVEGEQPADINFNSRYLAEAVNAIETERADFRMTSSVAPGTMRPENDASDYLHILMPMATHRA